MSISNFTDDELEQLDKVIEDDLSDVPIGRRFALRMGSKELPLISSIKKKRIIEDDYLFDKNSTAVLTAPLEEMPLYLNATWLISLIAAWRLSVGK